MLQDSLGVPASEVESLIVQAIGRRILEARIDQLRGVVSVAKCVPRTFGSAQWKELQQQLAAWQESVARVQAMAAEQQSGLPKAMPLRA